MQAFLSESTTMFDSFKKIAVYGVVLCQPKVEYYSEPAAFKVAHASFVLLNANIAEALSSVIYIQLRFSCIVACKLVGTEQHADAAT